MCGDRHKRKAGRNTPLLAHGLIALTGFLLTTWVGSDLHLSVDLGDSEPGLEYLSAQQACRVGLGVIGHESKSKASNVSISLGQSFG